MKLSEIILAILTVALTVSHGYSSSYTDVRDEILLTRDIKDGWNDSASLRIMNEEYNASIGTTSSDRKLQRNKPITLPFRMNCGNTQGNYTDPATGFTWVQDRWYTGSGTWNGCAKAASLNIPIATHLCETRNSAEIIYDILVPAPAIYSVTMYFTEVFFTLNGKRIFDVSAEGVSVLSSFDPHFAAGGIMKPVARTFPVVVNDGILTIRVTATTNLATISAIEITSGSPSAPAPVPVPVPVPAPAPVKIPVPVPAPVKVPLPAPVSLPVSTPTTKAPLPKPAPTKAPITKPTIPTSKPVSPVTAPIAPVGGLSTIRINSGASTPYTDPNGNVWAADVSFFGGGTFTRCPRSIANTDLDDVYCSERNWGAAANGTYTIPVIPGSYNIRLHFAEIFHTEAGKRVFNVYIQNQLVRQNLDIVVSAVGANTALIISTPLTVTSADPNVRIKFQNVLQNSKVSAIEIVPSGGSVPQSVPTSQPIQKPVAQPVKAPVVQPVIAPVVQPVKPPSAGPGTFQDILINCGFDQPYTDSLARVWSGDRFFVGGGTASKIRPIENTVDDPLYQYERTGESFFYEIPVPIGSYEVNLLFSENDFTATRQRLFDVTVEGEQQTNFDIFQMAGGAFTASTVQFISVVDDGFVTIQFRRSAAFPNAGLPKLNAIEILLDTAHIAHSVATGPYVGTVTNSATNKANVQLIGQTSHTHGDGLNLNSYSWKEGTTVLGTSVNTNYSFGVGNHTISLTVADNGGNSDTEITSVTINPFGYPAITSLDPSSGTLAGGYSVLIIGTGFTYSAAQTTVTFGTTVLTGSSITIVSSTSIRVTAPASSVALNTAVTVKTPLGTSIATDFVYAGFPIQWQEGQLLAFDRPTVGRFGPDNKLYVGTRKGHLLKVTMNDDFTAVTNTIASFVNEDEEAILGIAIDPLDVKEHPDIYFTANEFFHKGKESSSGTTIAGKIRRASGPNLETVVDIMTGLPVSGLDHGLNGMVFLDNGELLFNSGSHTNGGYPGKLSSSGVLKENFLSAAVGIAYLSHPQFDGNIKWSAPDDGNMIAKGIDLYAMGLRNPYGICLHTNGKVYGTDNGPNKKYGRMSKGCNGESIDDQKRDDEINLIEKGKYYGHPNFKRASYFNEPRQCVWRGPEEPSSADYTAPLLTQGSSIDGIFEFHGNHFGGQLRYNLFYIRYNGVNNIFRIALTADGRALLPSLNNKGINMNIGNLGLDLTQAPNGNLVEMRYQSSTVSYYKPVEPPTTSLIAKTCWPRRGRTSGGTPLTIYGVNINSRSPTVTVTVGGTNCPVTMASLTKVICTLPGGVGTVDIVVSNGGVTSTFERGYRYISGTLPLNFKLPVYSG